jgi:tRNA uridine 5-carboxymethylaminomethyl modification enzyme
MFTSRAEHRLLLRQDNADRRLMHHGFRLGLIPSLVFERLRKKEGYVKDGLSAANQISLSPNTVNDYLASVGSDPITEHEKLAKLVKRTGAKLQDIARLASVNNQPYLARLQEERDTRFQAEVLEQVEIELKYEGYIARQVEQVEKFEQYESHSIPQDFNFSSVRSLSTEGREKLGKVCPTSIGQASRISGVTPSDVSVLMVYLKR